VRGSSFYFAYSTCPGWIRVPLTIVTGTVTVLVVLVAALAYAAANWGLDHLPDIMGDP
jgi:hypothetical protein